MNNNKLYGYKVIGAVVPSSMSDRINDIANKMNKSRSYVIRLLLNKGLKVLKNG